MSSVEQVDGTTAVSDESGPQTKSLQHLDLLYEKRKTADVLVMVT